jgi:transcriptional regulator with XRE-family HTH domain
MTDTDWPARIARNMRLARALTGVSQQRLADQIGAVRTQVVDWESGRRGMPSIRNLERIALALGQTVGWFYDPHDENGGPA